MNDLDIKKIREQLNLSQEALAERLGVHPRTVQNWEAGGTIPKSKHAILCSLLPAQHIVFGGQHVQNGDAVNGDKIIENELEQKITDNVEETSALLHALDEITEMRKLLDRTIATNERTNDRLLTLLENLQNK